MCILGVVLLSLIVFECDFCAVLFVLCIILFKIKLAYFTFRNNKLTYYLKTIFDQFIE